MIFIKINARTFTRSFETFAYEEECVEDGGKMSTQLLKAKKSGDRLEKAFRARAMLIPYRCSYSIAVDTTWI